MRPRQIHHKENRTLTIECHYIEKAVVHLSLNATFFKLKSGGVVEPLGWNGRELSSWLGDGKLKPSIKGCMSLVDPLFDVTEFRRMSLTSVCTAAGEGLGECLEDLRETKSVAVAF